MNLISVENISKSYSEKKIIENFSFGINEGEKIGVIGVNGTGKSTLLKILAGFEDYEDGNIIKMNGIRIEYLSQNPEFKDGQNVIEAVFSGDSKEMKLLREYETTLEKIENQSGDFDKLNRVLLQLQAEIDGLNLWNMESEAKTILTKLGIKDFNANVSNLSGGQRKRIALARALINKCDLLILDEPTNHMDEESIEWLEDYLNKRKGALIMITHDRYFLDRVTNRIIELDKGRLYSYQGNYSLFIEKKIEREALEESEESKKRNLLRNELKWVMRGAKARSTKQKARLDRFDDLKNSISNEKKENLEISAMGSRLGKKIIEVENINKAFNNINYINNFSYKFLRDDRIGIVGKNGVGKSTLMNIISGKINPDVGEIEMGETVNIGYFSQENFHMDNNMRVIDYLKEVAEYLPTADGTRISASQMLEKFLFPPEQQYTLIEKLSGGEKRRLYLLRVLMGAPNVLLLDEPTNDLDIETLRILEDYLDDFNGPIITVSHDRYFLNRVCNKIFAYEEMGKIEIYYGNYDDYLEKKPKEAKVVEKKKEIKEKSKSDKKLKLSYKEQREYESIDDDIAELEEKISNIEAEMDASASEYSKLNDLIKEKEELEALLEEKYERWEYLNELVAEIEANKN